MKNREGIFGPTGANENNMLMREYDSQFTTPNHINTGQNESVTANSHEDASFVEF